jgi:RHS repeat-associated protein
LYSLQDANWNTSALVNTSGTVPERYTYTPFGQVTFRDGSGSTLSNSAKDWVFLHQGGERIAAGDYEFRNRLYSPSLGRWLSNDPLGFEAGDQNWYRAIGNNPGNGLDPSGLDKWWIWTDPLYILPVGEQNVWGDLGNLIVPVRSKAYIESSIGQALDPNRTDNPTPTLGSYLGQDFRDGVEVAKQGMMRQVGKDVAEKAVGAVAVGAAGVAAKKIYDARKAVKVSKVTKHVPSGPMAGKRIGHTFEKHGSHNTYELTLQAQGSGLPQGQWLDDIAAEKFIAEHLDELANGAKTINLPKGIGRVIMPNGSFVPATKARLVPSKTGVITAYPTN